MDILTATHFKLHIIFQRNFYKEWTFEDCKLQHLKFFLQLPCHLPLSISYFFHFCQLANINFNKLHTFPIFHFHLKFDFFFLLNTICFQANPLYFCENRLHTDMNYDKSIEWLKMMWKKLHVKRYQSCDGRFILKLAERVPSLSQSNRDGDKLERKKTILKHVKCYIWWWFWSATHNQIKVCFVRNGDSRSKPNNNSKIPSPRHTICRISQSNHMVIV